MIVGDYIEELFISYDEYCWTYNKNNAEELYTKS